MPSLVGARPGRAPPTTEAPGRERPAGEPDGLQQTTGQRRRGCRPRSTRPRAPARPDLAFGEGGRLTRVTRTSEMLEPSDLSPSLVASRLRECVSRRARRRPPELQTSRRSHEHPISTGDGPTTRPAHPTCPSLPAGARIRDASAALGVPGGADPEEHRHSRRLASPEPERRDGAPRASLAHSAPSPAHAAAPIRDSRRVVAGPGGGGRHERAREAAAHPLRCARPPGFSQPLPRRRGFQ